METSTITVPGFPSYWSYDLFPVVNPTAIVIGLHGWLEAGSKTYMNFQGHLFNTVVCYPYGQFLSWSYTNRSKDVYMLQALVARLRQRFGQLPVYLAGMSMGASMAYRAAVELPWDGVGAHSAGLNPIIGGLHMASKPLLHIHGTNDSIVPFNTYVPSIQGGIDFLRTQGWPVTLQLNQGQGHDWSVTDTQAYISFWGLS